MMKLRNYGIVMISMLILLGSCFTAAATSISDGTGDVWHYTYAGTAWSWAGNIANKPDIDITQISTTVNGDSLTLSLTMAGTIRSSEKIYYWAYFNTTDSTYSMFWYNGSGFAYASNHSYMPEIGNITISGNTLSAVFNVMGDTTTVELWGWAAEYTDYLSQTTNEWWGDWAPNSKLPFSPGTGGNTDGNNTDGNNDDGNNTGTKTPGFEVIPVIAAVAIAAILLRRRR
jgi:hypothetical protein